MKTLVIKGELIDLNTYIEAERSNKFAGAKLKKEMTKLVAWAAKAQRFDKVKPTDFLIFRWYCKNKRKDKDNVAFAKKFILDGLVIAGYLKNDGWNDIAGFMDEFYIDAVNPRVEVAFYV